MKINPSPGFNKYQTYVNSLKNSDKSGAKVPAGQGGVQGENTDKVMLSENAVARAEAGRVAAAAGAEVESLGNVERIAELKAQVESGEYYVSTDDLANAILGSIIK